MMTRHVVTLSTIQNELFIMIMYTNGKQHFGDVLFPLQLFNFNSNRKFPPFQYSMLSSIDTNEITFLLNIVLEEVS